MNSRVVHRKSVFITRNVLISVSRNKTLKYTDRSNYRTITFIHNLFKCSFPLFLPSFKNTYVSYSENPGQSSLDSFWSDCSCPACFYCTGCFLPQRKYFGVPAALLVKLMVKQLSTMNLNIK